jgi:hypothetical protein
MKKLVIGIALSAAVAAQIPAAAAPRADRIVPAKLGAGEATDQVDAQQIERENRAPIRFKPFPMADLRTGQALPPDTIITLKSGKQMKLGDFIAQINQLEAQANEQGLTLRKPGVFKIQALKVDQEQLQAQKAMLHALPPASSAVLQPSAAQRAVIMLPINAEFVSNSAGMSKTWSQSYGSKDSVGASFSGELNVNGSAVGVNASGVARASGAILGKEWDLIRVTGNMNAPKAGGGTVKVNLYVVGFGDTAFTSASGNFSRQVDVSHKFRFSVGPIPMSAKLGVRGTAGVQYGVALKPAGVNVQLTPKVHVAAYGQGGVDVGVAEGGIGAELTLLSKSLQIGVDGEVIDVQGKNALKARCYAVGSVAALSGRLYAYAKVDVWLWEDEWQWTIWNYEGFRKDFTLFDESKTMAFGGATGGTQVGTTIQPKVFTKVNAQLISAAR